MSGLDRYARERLERLEDRVLALEERMPPGCDRCGKRPSEERHGCPKAVVVLGMDDPGYCNCCEGCVEDCRYEI